VPTASTFRFTFGFWFLAAGLIVAASCAPPRFTLPSGPGVPAPDLRAAFAEATAACRGARTYSAELRLSGRAGATGRVKATAVTGVTSEGRIRLEIPAPFGRAAIVLAGGADRATLVTRDDRVLIARAADIVEAIVGVALTPSQMLALLTGCGASRPPEGEPVRYGALAAAGSAETRVFLRQDGARWRVAAAEVSGLVVDYPAFAGEWPPVIRLTSMPGRAPALSLTIDASQIEVNGPLPASAFTIDVPAGGTPLTLEELRANGPLGGK